MATNQTILVIDDDQALIDLVSSALASEGYAVRSARDGQDGLRQMFHHRPSLILLDINMPGMDGWTTCQRIREVSSIPIMMLTARDEPEEIVRGLDLGADDYIIKPFKIGVLMARIRATLRRAASAPGPTGREGGYKDHHLTINIDERRVVVRGELVRLTPTEFNLMATLLEASPRIIAYRDLLEQVWGFEYIDDIDYLRVYIWHLRRKLEPDPKNPIYVINELGVGYRFEKHR